MTKVKKLLKKAFTLVELVVVVAIIAILSGVSVAAYVGITDRANKAADQDVVAQLNLQLAAQEAIEGKNKTCFEAIQDCYSTGLNVEDLKTNTKNAKFVWDEENDRFAIINDSNEIVAEDSTYSLTKKTNLIWVLTNTYTANEYSQYLLSGVTETELNVSTSVDTGINNKIKSINYVQSASATVDAVIRTNIIDCRLTIDATANVKNVQHYGIIGEVLNISTGSSNKYVENGTTCIMHIGNNANVYFADRCKVFSIIHNEGETVNLSSSLTSELYDIWGEADRQLIRKINNDLNGTYTKYGTYLQTGCNHASHEIIIDANGPYDICLGCGNSLGMYYSTSTKSYCKAATFKDNRSPMFLTLNTYNENTPDFYFEAWCITPNKETATLSPSSTPEALTKEQRYCTHENLIYSQNTTNGDYHNVQCKDCGYSFTDIHDSNNECALCGKVNHKFNANHECEIHGDRCTHYTITDRFPGETIDVTFCDRTVNIWGLTDISKKDSYAINNSKSLEEVLGDLEGVGKFYFNNAVQIKVVFHNALYIPTKFLQTSYGRVYDITLPEGLQYIGDTALSGQNVKRIHIPNSVTYIGPSAFSISAIRSIETPSKVTEILDCTFMFCESLSNVVLNEGLLSIGSQAFSVCTSLEELTIPVSVQSINIQAIYWSDNVQRINYPGTMNQWKQINWINNDYTPLGTNKWFEDAPSSLVVVCNDGTITAPTV